MDPKFSKFALLFPLLVGALLTPAAFAQNVKVPPDEAAGVANRRGDASPPGGFSAGQTNSRIDDYFHQDEQINIDVTDGVVKVLRVNQKVLLNDFVTVLIPLRNVTPREIRDVFRTITGKEGGRAEVVQDKKAKEYFLQVICPEFQIPHIEAAVAALDVPWIEQQMDGSVIGTYRAKYRNAPELDLIASRYAGEGATFVGAGKNVLRRRDEPYRVEKYLEAAAMQDHPQPQAIFEFRVYEIDASNDLRLGVDWIAWKNGPGRSLFEVVFGAFDGKDNFENATGFFDPVQGSGTVFANGSNTIESDSTQYLLSANYLLTSAFIDFLRVKGKARVLDEATIIARTSELGVWSSVDEFLSLQVSPDNPGARGLKPQRLNAATVVVPTDEGDVSAGNDFSTHNRFVEYVRAPKNSVGIELAVFPVIGLESTEVDVLFEVTSVIGATPQGTPILSDRSIEAKVRVVDGQPFVLGGLTREEDVKTSNKAPWLGDIPILGYLFGQESSTSRRKELIITCTPRIFATGLVDEERDPDEIDTIAMATGAKEIAVPETSFGFDQFLFDDVEHP